MSEPTRYDPMDEEIHQLEQELQAINQRIQNQLVRNTILRTEVQRLDEQLHRLWF